MGVVVNAMPCHFMLGEETRYLLYVRPCGPHGRSGPVRKISLSPAFDPRTFHPIASGYTDYDMPAHIIQYEGWSEIKNKRWIFPYSVPFCSWSPWNVSRMCQIVSSVNVCPQHVILWTEPLWDRISFLAVQVIFICVYITNYLHFSTIFLSF